MKPANLTTLILALAFAGVVHASGDGPAIQMAVELAGPFTVSGIALPDGEKMQVRAIPVESRAPIVCQRDPHTPSIRQSGTAAAARTTMLSGARPALMEDCPAGRNVYILHSRLPQALSHVAGPAAAPREPQGIEVIVTY